MPVVRVMANGTYSKTAPRGRALGQNATKTKHYTNTMCNTSKGAHCHWYEYGRYGAHIDGSSRLVGWLVRAGRCLNLGFQLEDNECGIEADRLNRRHQTSNRFMLLRPAFSDALNIEKQEFMVRASLD